MILYLTDKGVTILRGRLGYVDEDIHQPLKIIRSWNALQALIAVNNFRCQLMRADRMSEKFVILDWIVESHFRSNPDLVRVRNREKPVYPDGLMHLETPDFYSYCYIEVDSGSERLEDVKRQLEVYHAYIRSDLHKKRFNSAGFRVLIVTSSERRLQGIVAKAHEVGISGHFWFTTMEAVQSETVFTAPIWYRYVDGVERRMSLSDID